MRDIVILMRCIVVKGLMTSIALWNGKEWCWKECKGIWSWLTACMTLCRIKIQCNSLRQSHTPQ